MAADHLEPRAILATLGYAGADAVTPVSGGRDTAIYRVECDGAAWDQPGRGVGDAGG